MNLIEEVLTEYIAEGKRLYKALYLDPTDRNTREKCVTYIDLLTRYEFICQLFSDLNWFSWRDKTFNIEEHLR